MKNLKKIFESERIEFVVLSENLINDYLIMVNDPEVAGLIRREPIIFTREQEKEWVKTQLDSKAYCYSMIEKSSGDFIGNIEIMNIRNNLGEVGISITAKKQNLHFGTEALNAILDYARKELGLENFDLKVHPENVRAIHCYEKVGFKKSGTEENGDIYMTLGV